MAARRHRVRLWTAEVRVGGVIGGLEGALIGSAIGAGGAIVATEGVNVTLPAGSIIRIRLNSSVQV